MSVRPKTIRTEARLSVDEGGTVCPNKQSPASAVAANEKICSTSTISVIEPEAQGLSGFRCEHHNGNAVAIRAFVRVKHLKTLPSDPRQSAVIAGLRYVTCASPGLRRRRSGNGFAYYGRDGALIRDRETLPEYAPWCCHRRGVMSGSVRSPTGICKQRA